MIGAALVTMVAIGAGCPTATPAATADVVSSDTSDAIDDGGAEVDTGPERCHELQETPEAGCCPAGHMFSNDTGQCEAVGPPECADVIFDAPETCVPRWCWDWTIDGTSGSASCVAGTDACLVAPRACIAEELAAGGGCPAGSGPDFLAETPGGPLDGCFAAGWFPDLGAIPVSAADSVADLPAVPLVNDLPGAPPYIPLPAPDDTEFCWDDATGSARICAENESVCGPGQMPDPADPASCLAVGVARLCPDGFSEGPPGAGEALPSCVPDIVELGVSWTCPPGFELNGSACQPATSSCAPVAPGPTIIHVSASAAAGGDGSSGSPFQTVSEAIAAAAPGGTVAVAAGTYAEDITITKVVTLKGECAATTQLKFVLANNGAVVTLEDVTLSNPAGDGLAVANGGSVVGRRLHISAPSNTGAHVEGLGSNLVLEDSLVADSEGVGVGVVLGATATLTRVRVTGSRGRGIEVNDADSAVTAEELRVDGTRGFAGTEAEGQGILVIGGADFSVTRAVVTGNRLFGVHAKAAATTLALDRVVIDGTLPDVNNAFGGGVLVDTGANVMLDRVFIEGCRDTGLLATGSGTFVDAFQVVIADTQADVATLASGYGVVSDAGARVELRDVRVSRATHSGILAQTAELLMERVLIDNTNSQTSTGIRGNGLRATLGATVTGTSVRIHRAREVGMHVSGDGTDARFVGFLMDETLGQTAGNAYGWGIEHVSGGTLRLEGARVSDSRGYGIGAGAPMTAFGLIVDKTVAIPTEQGVGVVVIGVAVTLESARVSSAAAWGLTSEGGADVTARGLLVDDGTGAETFDVVGGGLLASGNSRLSLSRVRATGNAGFGLFVQGPATQVDMTDGLIDNTLPQIFDQKHGRAIMINDSGTVKLLRTRLSFNHDTGITANGAQARLSGTGVLIDVTRQDVSEQRYGSGIFLNEGAQLHLRAARITASHQVGVGLVGAGTSAVMEGVLIDKTKPDSAPVINGFGVIMNNGADSLLISGSRLSANQVVGLGLEDGTGRAVGVLVDGTLRDPNGYWGGAAYAAGPAVLDYAHCQFVDNWSVALSVVGTDATVEGCVITQTAEASYLGGAGEESFTGDGIVAEYSPQLTIKRTVVAANERAGITVFNTAEGQQLSLGRNVVSANSVGMLTDGVVTIARDANLVFGNSEANERVDGNLVALPPLYQ